MSVIYNIEDLSDGTFHLSFNLIDRYQKEEPLLTENLKCTTYQKGYFWRGRNTVEIVTYKNKIVIT